MRNIYFLRPVGMAGPIKIGCSQYPKGRLQSIAAWSPFPLEIVAITPGDFRLERRLHGLFAKHHQRCEWFTATPELVALVEHVAAGGKVTDLIDLTAEVLPFQRRSGMAATSPERRRYFSYSHRTRWALERLSRQTGRRMLQPRVVSDILWRWFKETEPSVKEMALLDAFIANPGKYVRRSLADERYAKIAEEQQAAKPKRARAA